MSPAQAIQTIRPAVVQIRIKASSFPSDVHSPEETEFAEIPFGTGFLVGSGAHVVTALHVIRAAEAKLASLRAGRKVIFVGLALPNSETIRAFFVLVQFDIVGIDEAHDLALLKLRQNPFKGEVRSGFRVGNDEVQLPVASASLGVRKPEEGLAIAISGYPLGQAVLVTKAGWMASSWAYKIGPPTTSEEPPWFRPPSFVDFYLADVTANPGNSGGPVYSIEDGTVIGLCQGTLPTLVLDQQHEPVVADGRYLLYSSGLTAVIPVEYIWALLTKHSISFPAPSQ